LEKSIFDVSKIESIIGYKFKDKNLIRTAFTHSSYANEHKAKSYERLEFLGDSVLGFVVTTKLYKSYSLTEGNLSKFRQKLVSEEPLAFIVEELGLDKFILKGKGESRNKVDSKAIKADIFEAICAAICLDGGLEPAEKFVLKNLESVFKSYETAGDFEDSKSKLQEKLVGAKIIYNTKKIDKLWYFEYDCKLKVNGIIVGVGRGKNKKSAEQVAASEALRKITKE